MLCGVTVHPGDCYPSTNYSRYTMDELSERQIFIPRDILMCVALGTLRINYVLRQLDVPVLERSNGLY